MSINIGTLDIGVAFAGDTSGLQKATADAQQGIDRFGATTSKAMRQVREDTKGVEDALNRLSQGFKGAVIGSSVAVGLIKLKNTAIEVGDALIQAQVQLDKLNNGFKFGAGGAAGGARELAFVREEANRLGLEIGGAATQYMKMVAAARGTNMEGEKTRQFFTAIAEASTVMGMSGEQYERAMAAVVQMMSKGKVQAEELRGQLGEHLPGAFAIAARAMGVTEAKLNELMEAGQVVAGDFLPQFAAQLRGELAGSVEDATKSMQASLNRFETAWATFKQNVAQSGASNAIRREINAISDYVSSASDAIESARKAGASGAVQILAGLGNVVGRSLTDTVSGTFNTFNGLLNAASLGALNLKTNVDLLPDSFRTSAQQVQLMTQKISEAEARYADLSYALKEAPENIYIKSELTYLARYISELERARAARDSLAGAEARRNTGSVSESRISAVVDAEYLKAQQAKGQAYAKLMGDMATPQEKFTAAVFAAKKDLVELYSPEVEARIRKHFINPTHDGINALANQKAKLEDAKQYAINLQRELQDIMAGGTGEGAKLTESEKSAIKLQELLQTSIKGAARASTEKQLAVALETVSVEKANRAAERQIQIQKDVEKHRDSELRSLASEATAIQAKAAALNAELDVHGKSKAAIEAGVLARLRENAADVAMFSNSGDVVAAITAKIEAQTKYVAALKATDYKSFNEHTDELLRAAKEQQMLYQDELQLTGMTTLERNKIVAARSVELKYAKELSALDQSGLSVAEKETQRLKILEAKRIESAAAEGKAIQAEFERVSNEIEQTLTDALMRGFESGKGFAEVLRDTVANMFKTLVLRPIVSAIVNPVAGAITSSLGVGGGTGGNLLGTASSAYNAYSMYGALSNGTIGASIFGGSGMYASGLGMASSAAGSQAAMLAAQTGEFGAAGLAMTAEAAGTAATTAASAASATASASSAIAAAAPWLLGGVAVLSLLKSLDDSGTYHTGGLGSYSAAGGTAVGDAVKGQGLGFDLAAKDYTASSQQAAAALAQSVVGMLDSTANTFGAQAGYYAATAFADDTSKDGAWGALMLKLGDKVLIDWQQGADKWPGREFADGEAGAKEYAAAISVAVRDQLITQVPDWADAMLTALGDTPTLENLSTVVAQINAAAAAMTGMGKASQAFAGMSEAAASALIAAMGGAEAAVTNLSGYYTNFYTESERAGIATADLTKQLSDLGVALPTSREAFKGLVDAAVAAGDTTLAAGLIKLQGQFAALVPAAEDAAAAVASSVKAMDAETKRLQRQLIEAQGGDLVAFDTEGMSVAERAAYAFNQSLRAQIDATNAAKNATDTLADAQQQAADTAQQAAADTLSAWQDAQRNMAQGWLEGAQKLEDVRYESAQRELDAARQAASAIASARTSAAQVSIDAISGIAGALRSAREALTGTANQPLTTTSYGAARGLIDQAAATGNLNQAGLEDALKIVSGNTQSLFGRFEDWAMAQAAASAPVSKLDAQAQGQMAAAQAIIDAMKAQEDEAALRYDESKRVLGDNHNAMMDSLQMQYEAQLAQIEATNAVGARFDMAVAAAVASAGGGGGGGGGVAMPDFSGLTDAIRQMATSFNLSYDQAAALVQGGKAPTTQNGNTTFVMADGTVLTAPSGSADAAKYQAMWDTSMRLRQQIEQQTGASFYTGLEGEVAYYKKLIDPTGNWNPNITATDFLNNLKSRGVDISKIGSGTQADLYSWLGQYGIKPYDTGINFVPNDQLAYIHKGEAVVPAAYNPFNPNASRPMSDNSAVVAELRTLNERMARVEAATTATAGFTAGTDRKLARVIKADAITTEAIA